MNVRTFFANLKIRIKLLLAFGSIVLLSVILAVLFIQTFSRIAYYKETSENVDAANIYILEMDAAAKYFMFEGFKDEDFQHNNKSVYGDAYRRNFIATRNVIDQLKGSAKLFGQNSITTSIEKNIAAIDHSFEQLTALLKTRGFKDFGLEGDLRKAIHDVENSSFSYDKSDMLMLRRHEKDFFLRKDLKYQHEFNKKLDVFKSAIEASPAQPGKDEILHKLADYRNRFNEIVKIDEEIGLKDTEGLKGILNKDFHDLKNSVRKLRASIKEKSEVYIQKKLVSLGIIFLMQFTLGIILAIVYANLITKAIKEIQRAMKHLSEGMFPDKLVVRTSEEIGKTKQAFNQLLDRIQAATFFSEALGNGQLNASYSSDAKNDVLAKSMIKMQKQLIESHEKQTIINWGNYGTVQLSDILKNESADILSLGDQIIKLLVHYVDLNQGALYIIDTENNETFLEQIATYAYGKKKYIQQRINVREGLTGQCVMEKATIVLTAVPEDYIKITSGLGAATPRYVIILPLKSQDDVVGVLELAGFRPLESYKVEFLEKISGNIASILSNKKINSETQRLLTEAREKGAQLAAREEEIRQNQGEMQAIREQMTRHREALEQEITTLKLKLVHSKPELA